MRIETKAVLALFAVTFFWGMTFPLIRASAGDISPGLFVAIRLGLSALLFIPLVIGKKYEHKKLILKIGFIFGMLEGASYLFQTIGLVTISSSESAFITAFSVVLIPFLSPLFGLDRLRINGVIASALCLLGIFILSGAEFTHLATGYFWTFGCATAYALSVVYLSYETRKMEKNGLSMKNTRLLVLLQIAFGVPIPLTASYFENTFITFSPIVVIALVFCAASTIFCYVMQTNYQKKINMNKVAVIYAFEPIFATVFGRLINAEPIYLHTVIGGAFVIASFLIVELF